MALCLDESYFPAPPTRLADWTHVQKVRPSAYYGSVGFGCNPSPDLIRPYNVAGLPACPRRASNLDPLTEVDECRSRTGCPNQKDRRDTWFNRNFIPDEPAPENQEIRTPQVQDRQCLRAKAARLDEAEFLSNEENSCGSSLLAG